MNILACGCSMTYGAGLKHNITDEDLWVNSLVSNVFGKNATVNNISKIGMNNHWIFLETMNELRRNDYDFVIVGWSSIPRYAFHVDVELHSVQTMLNLNNGDINTNRFGTISAKWLDKTGDRLRKIHNDFWDTLDLIKYINVLVDSVEENKISFVNTLINYPRGYFDYNNFDKPSELTLYEQDLLNAPNRNDDDIHMLYDMMHNEFSKYGDIQESKWLNLYESLKSMQVDVISEYDGHPSYKSQKIYVEKFVPILIDKIG